MLLKNKTYLLYGTAIILNLLLSYFVLLYRQPFNVDGILYLKAAQTYLDQGLHAAIQVYAWPFYSVLLAKFSQFTHLSLLNAGLVLGAIFTSILVVFFLLLIKEIGGTRVEQYWALLIVLIYPYLYHDRYNILRDFGYYAFFLVSLWCLMRHLRQGQWRYALSWQITVWLAVAFRVEGLVLLFFAPFIVLFSAEWSWQKKCLSLLKCHCLNLLLFIVAVCCFRNILDFGRIPEILHNIQPQQFLTVFQQKSLVIQQQIFDTFGKDNAGLFLAGGIVTLFFKAIIDTLGVFYAALTLYAWFNKQIHLAHPAKLALMSYIILVLLTLMAFLCQALFLSGRYMVPLSLLCMLWIPFALQHLWLKNNRMIKLILGTLLLITAVDCFAQFGPSKTYVIDAGTWLQKNTSPQSRIYINDAQLFYYTNRPGMEYPQDFMDKTWWPRLQQVAITNYNYAAIVQHHDDKVPTEQQLVALIGQPPIKIFENNREDKVYIFDTSEHSSIK